VDSVGRAAVAPVAKHAHAPADLVLHFVVALLVLAACGKTEPAASSPRSEPEAASAVAPEAQRETAAANPLTPAEPVARVGLEIEFHRTRAGVGESGYWVLGELHNTHGQVIADPRAEVRLLDAEGELVASAEAALGRALPPDAKAAVAVYVAEPVEHEELELRASGVLSELEPTPLPLELEYEKPARAELGGYFVLGQVTNKGDETIDGARLEIRGLDREGRLLGVDWLVLDPIEAKETIQFDVGDLRYEEPPASFVLELRQPAQT
jgi:hypothetical protein